MLNANAKAFIPPGVIEGAPPSFHTIGWYRYCLSVPVERKMSALHEDSYLNSISSLLSLRYLYADRGGLDDDSLQYFINGQFIMSNNIPSSGDEEHASSGFLLSRSILTLYTDLAAIKHLNDSRGLLVHLDLPTEFNGDVSIFLASAWEAFFAAVSENPSVSAVGYSRSVVGMSGNQTNGTYRHYFFAACALPESLELVIMGTMSEFPVPVARIVHMKSVVPYLCSPHLQLGVMITVGDEAKRSAIKDRNVDFSLEMTYRADNFLEAWKAIRNIETHFLEALNRDVKWDRIHILHLHIDPTPTENPVAIPIWDIVWFIGLLCDDCSASIIGVSFSTTALDSPTKELVSRNKSAPFYVCSNLDAMLVANLSLDTKSTYYGGVPSHVKTVLPCWTWEPAVSAMELWQRARKHLSPVEMLTRMSFADAADSFARGIYTVHRKAVGTPIVLGTDSKGNIFGYDVDHNSVFGLPLCFGGTVDPVISCVFKGTLSSSYRSSLDYRIIIDDILLFKGKETKGIPFAERMRMLSNLGIEDESTWPHADPAHIVILKAECLPLDSSKKLVDTPVFDHSNMGLVFTPSIQPDDNSVFPTFVWVPPTSLTVRFVVENIVVANEMNEGFDRAYLGVSSNNVDSRIIIPYEGEFADYQREAYPTLGVGSIVECLLRRADDGAHWWDVLQDFDIAEKYEADSFDHVDELVHSPGVTQEEMLWLLKAPSYQCERCHKVNDVGRRNNRHNAYWCKNCWIETGHGDCVYCGRTFVLGMLDGTSNFFYCEECWRSFSTFNTDAEIGYHVPPPPNATFTQQVTTRCVSLLIDLMNPKTPSNDILDLCCGGSVARKWMRNKTSRYVGIDLKRSVVDAITSLICDSKEMPPEARYDVICGDVFSEDFWMSTIVKMHPRQFHLISCFAGLHHAFSSEEKARHFLGSIANALVPGGTFLGMFIDASVLFAKGKTYANSIMKAGWSVDSVPRIGHTFQFTTNNGPMRDVNVIPIDFLIAVASEYGLHAVSEAYLTFRELIEKDASWTKVPSTDEKEYLCARRTFAFKKESNELTPSSPARKSDTD
ncbi:mRNA capping enzyme-like protein [Leishmania panamensis]|uniref:mRNA (guanine-N(7))-methyltransferase n=1 Tax=Leishmania panamensis TaxID=5679 RepID=A0A088RKB1_LEIPA|nr:mRNA capping enzyme-like protein [Leishmania panamensis]AIN96245.1 mRNA capping enzyme-like protein [Leishmania panamensis]